MNSMALPGEEKEKEMFVRRRDRGDLG